MTFKMLTTGYCLADESHVLRGGRRGVSVQCPARAALFEHPQGRILFDTGYAATHLFAAASRFPYKLYLRATPVFTSPEESLMAQLSREGIAPNAIHAIIVSHFHADHIAGLKDFPCAHFIASAEGLWEVQNRRGFGALKRAFLPELLPTDFAERATLLEYFTGPELAPFGPTHDLFGDGLLRLVRLPGHARGQLGLFAQTSRGTVFLVADAAYCRQAIRENRPPHPITNLFTDKGAAVCATLAKLHAFAAAHPEVLLYPTHCTETDP
ncbi:MBL fold metallo-hydrolase [Armatimonas sp.]|uniref:MBL fold metallo-hydrolase n=1 Tax=Armatimonas sp. TaxID=1872638 RepID=UPI003753B68B